MLMKKNWNYIIRKNLAMVNLTYMLNKIEMQ